MLVHLLTLLVNGWLCLTIQTLKPFCKPFERFIYKVNADPVKKDQLEFIERCVTIENIRARPIQTEKTVAGTVAGNTISMVWNGETLNAQMTQLWRKNGVVFAATVYQPLLHDLDGKNPRAALQPTTWFKLPDATGITTYEASFIKRFQPTQ